MMRTLLITALKLRQIKRRAMQPVCLVRGHRYDTPFFMTNCLYFCARCGREMMGRTSADIKPLTDEEREMLDAANYAYGGKS